MTMGTAGRSATSSTMPLGRTSRWASGAAEPAGTTSTTTRTSASRTARRRMDANQCSTFVEVSPVVYGSVATAATSRRARSRTWDEDPDALAGGLEVGLGHTHHVGRRDGAQPVEILVHQRVAPDELEPREQRGATVNRIFLEHERG